GAPPVDLPIAIPVDFDRLFNDEVEKSFTIVITEDEWDNLDLEMRNYHSQFGNYRTDFYAKADVIYTDSIGNVHITDIGFRTRGNLSRVRIQNDDGSPNLSHFKIKFNADFNPSNSKRRVFDVEELDMKFNRNHDDTYLTEKYSMDLFNDMGVFAAKTTLAKFYIQIGETTHFYGIYTIFEPIDNLFIQKRLDKVEAEGNLYKSLWQQFGPANLGAGYHVNAIGIKDTSINYRPAYDLKTNKKINDHTELINFIKEINQRNGTNFKQYIEANFDVSMFLKYLAVGVLLGNPDDYRAMGNNYYLYQNSATRKWMMIPYDYDHGLGQGWDGAQVFSNWTVGADIYKWGNLNGSMLNIENYPHPLVDKILKISEYQLEYEGYLRELIDQEKNLFSHERFNTLFQMQKSLYDDDVSSAMMSKRFGLRNTSWYFNAKINDIQSQLNYYEANPGLRGT
ncbi:MAG: CotH kinase family protein, partial [Acholeplasmataceae bacterium]|nr:CotH kinase family protein [Acholeplasmataceae bacterium]